MPWALNHSRTSVPSPHPLVPRVFPGLTAVYRLYQSQLDLTRIRSFCAEVSQIHHNLAVDRSDNVLGLAATASTSVYQRGRTWGFSVPVGSKAERILAKSA